MAGLGLTNSFPRFVLLVCLSIGVMIADHRSHYLQQLRAGIAVLVTPVQMIATVPGRIGDWFGDMFGERGRILNRNSQLEQNQATLKARLQRFEALEEENDRLRALLSASKRVPDKVLMAELIEVSLDPYNHRILLDRGSRDGARLEQPVLDPDGVIGQLTQVMPFYSVVTLITDTSHAIPVQVRRNGVRAVAFGIGKIDALEINYLTPNADIAIGDVLVTSGLGGRFPAGYPVAKVAAIERDPGAAFLQIQAQPVAQLDRARHVLLLEHSVRPRLLLPGNEDGGAAQSSKSAKELLKEKLKAASGTQKPAPAGNQNPPSERSR